MLALISSCPGAESFNDLIILTISSSFTGDKNIKLFNGGPKYSSGVFVCGGMAFAKVGPTSVKKNYWSFHW